MSVLNEILYRPWGSPLYLSFPRPLAHSTPQLNGRSVAARRIARSFDGLGKQGYMTLTELQRRNKGEAGFVGIGYTSSQTIAVSAPQIAGGALTAVAASGGIWGMAPALAIPVIGTIVAGVTMGLVALFSRKGPKQRVATTEIVNKVEPMLKQNVDGYLAGPRTLSSQAQALANFDAGWQFVLDNCGIAEMGNPGQACINDRKAGACVWKDAQGQCWNWFLGYRDPISSDPNVVADPLVDAQGNLVSSGGGLFGGTGGGSSWLLLGALALGAVALMGTGGKGGGK